jgi:tape measure domain-containing protein
MSSYVINIIVEGKDNASAPLGRVQGALGNMLSVAGGVLISKAIEGVTTFLGGLGRQALESIGNVQNLEIAMEGLLTQSLMYQQVNEVRQEAVGLTEKETQRLAELHAQLGVQNARLQEQKQRVWEMTNQWTDAGLATQTAKARLTDMEVEIRGTEQEIAALTKKQTEYTTITEASWQKTMDFADAQVLAKEQAADLLGFVEKLSIVSPFETSQVELVTKLALGAKFSTDEIKKLIPAFLDYSAVVGIGSENLAFAFDQFTQLRKAGKLSEIDLRQLRRLGIDVAQVLGVKMGMSVEEFNKQVGQSPELMDQLFESFVEFAGETTKGAAGRMATTVSGMMSTAHDIIEVGSRNLFRPIVEAASPFLADLLSNISDFVTGPRIRELGQRFGERFTAAFDAILKKGQELFQAFQTGGVGGLVGALGLGPDATELIMKVIGDITWLSTTLRDLLVPIFNDVSQNAMPLLMQAISFINEHWEAFRGAIVGVAAVLGGALIAGAIGALVGLLGTLLSPIGLIIGAAALLGAAWGENWFGIRDTLTTFWENTGRPILEQLWAWLQVNVPIAIQFLSDFWQTTLLPALQVVWDFITNTLVPILIVIWNWLSLNLPLAIQTLTDFWNTVLLPALTAVWAFIQDPLLPLIIALVNLGLAVAEKATEALAIVWETRLKPALQKVWSFIQAHVMPIFTKVSEQMEGPLADAVNWVKDRFDAFKDSLGKIKDTIKKLIEMIEKFTDKVKNIDLGPLTPGSPSPFEVSVTGVNSALRQMNALMDRNPLVLGRLAATGQATTNNYYQMTVNTRATAPTVRQDFRTMQALYG